VHFHEAIEEAICFGWVDSKANKRDEENCYLLFSPRNPKSTWGKANRARAEKMIQQGVMTQAGQALIDLAKKTGTWDALADAQNTVIPLVPSMDKQGVDTMFDDARSKRVVMLSHCLLNQNSISDGTADFPSQFAEIIEFLMTHRIGMIQLPCPELLCLGLDRRDYNGAKRLLLEENTRIRELMGEQAQITLLRQKAEELVRHIQEYQRYGFEVIGVIGVNRSPSCGIDTTSRNGEETPGQGVFMEVLSETLSKHGMRLRMIGTKTSEKEISLEKIRQFIDR
jgi:predicted secreted protein